MLQLCNSPDPNCNLSPAQIIFGHPLRDSFSFVNRLEKFSNPHIRPLWRQACAAKEEALRTRITCTIESLKAHSHPLRPLTLDERVFLQNQQGPNPTKWDCSGVEVESAGHVQYRVKVDGSGRITLRNRRFLRAYTPATPPIRSQQPTASQLPTSSADRCPNPSALSANRLPSPRSPRRQRPTTQTWSKPQHHCRSLPQRDRHRTTVQTSTYSPGTSSYQQVPMKTPQCTLCHPHCHPNQFHALVASHGHPNGTNLKQENGSLESASLCFKLARSRSSDWGDEGTTAGHIPTAR